LEAIGKLKALAVVALVLVFQYLWMMEVHFTPEQEKRLTQIAANAGTDPERLVKDAALRLLEQQAGSPPLPAGSVLDEMRALRARIKPDPEGWTTRDYIQYGRR